MPLRLRDFDAVGLLPLFSVGFLISCFIFSSEMCHRTLLLIRVLCFGSDFKAVECGVALPYSHHLRVKRFFRKCEIFFSRRPSSYAALIKAFHNFSSKPMDGHLFTEVVNTVLPLLRGQKDLVQVRVHL